MTHPADQPAGKLLAMILSGRRTNPEAMLLSEFEMGHVNPQCATACSITSATSVGFASIATWLVLTVEVVA